MARGREISRERYLVGINCAEAPISLVYMRTIIHGRENISRENVSRYLLKIDTRPKILAREISSFCACTGVENRGGGAGGRAGRQTAEEAGG